MIQRVALLSVFNKDGIEDFARELISLDFRLIASGGTASRLLAAGLQVQDVAEIVGGGPILDHRVVTLSREIHAGLLAQDNQKDRAELESLRIPFIDLVCVDLYPLEEEIAREGSTPESVLEKTDIGGPTMLRSAAKGRRIIVCDPQLREDVIDWLKTGEKGKEAYLTYMASLAETIVSEYTQASAKYTLDIARRLGWVQAS